MTVPNPTCTNCGANLTTDDLRGNNCAYCGTVLPHRARAAQQVAVVQEMLADRNGNGIPDAFEGLVQNAQNNAVASFSAGAGVHVVSYQSVQQGAPPPMGAPFAAMQAAQMNAAQMQAAQMNAQMNAHAAQQVQAATRSATTGIVVAIVVVVLVLAMLVVAGAVFFLVAAR
jgi:cobalamin biosynthesis Mg chelatase CobN